MDFLNEFSQHYKPADAILWYTRAGCLFRMLNQAFRDENLDNIFIYRSFIRDLSDQIDILHMEQRESGFDSCTVYRGTCLAYDDIAVLKSNKGKLISFNGFLSTSVYAEVAELFKQPSNDQEQMESVLFEYYIDANLETSSFAYVAFLSASPDEGEVLFNIGTIFRINQIKYDESKKLWHVHCALCAKSEVGHHFMDVERKTEAYNFFYFGYLLVMAGETDRAEKFYLKILREEVDITVKALCYCRLARIYSDKGEWTRSIDMYKKLFQHSSYLSKNYGEFSKLINIDKRIVRVVVEIGEYDLALQLLTQELSLLDDTDPNHSYHLAIVLFNIATVYKLRGDDERAREYFKQIEELSDDSFTGPEEAALHNNIALMAMDRGDVDVALRYFRKAATILRETLPSMHEEFVTLYNNIGFAFTKQGNLDSALEYFNMALKIADSPSKSKYLMNVYLHLGYVHSLRGDFDVTETFYEKALLLLPEKLPEYRSSLAGIYTNTGTVLAEREKLDAFEMVFTKASEIYSQNMSSRMAAICFEHMADLYAKKHLFAKALIFSTRALEMQMQGYGENHHSTATAYRQLADMYYMSGDENRASEFHKKSLSILENITVSSEASEIERATLYESMGTVHLDRAECALGCEYYMKSLKIREHLLSEKHPDLIKTYVLLGRSYFRLGELDLATNYYNEASLRGSVDVQIDLGDIYLDRKQYDLAEKEYINALESYKAIYGENNHYTCVGYSRMGVLYKQLNNYEQASRCYKKILASVQKTSPDCAELIFKMMIIIADLAANFEDNEEAFNYYTSAVELLDPNQAELMPTRWHMLHSCIDTMNSFYKKSKWKQALDFCQKAHAIQIQFFPEDLDTGSELESCAENLREKLEIYAPETISNPVQDIG